MVCTSAKLLSVFKKKKKITTSLWDLLNTWSGMLDMERWTCRIFAVGLIALFVGVLLSDCKITERKVFK